MGFYNIMLEGQQAEEYKARKAKEAEEHDEKEFEKDAYRLMGKKAVDQVAQGKRPESFETPGDKYTDKYYKANPGYDKKYQHMGSQWAKDLDRLSDLRRSANADNVVSRELHRRNNGKEYIDGDEMMQLLHSTDAVNRHMRRHPDQWDGDKRIKTRSESGIFESVEFLNETTPSRNTERKDILKFCKKELRSSKLSKFINNKLENDKNIETVNIWIAYPDSDKYEYSYNDFVEDYEDCCEICDIYQNPSYAATKDGADFDKYISEFVKELNKKLKEAGYNATVEGGMYGKTGTMTVKVK